MKKFEKLVVAALLLCVMAVLFPTGALAEELNDSTSQEPVTYIERSWDGSKVVEKVCTVTDYIEVTPGITEFENNKIYVVKGNVTVSKRIRCRSLSRLVLTDGCNLEAEKGICVEGGCMLQIFGQEKNSGKLYANRRGGDTSSAGIGGDYTSARSTVQIHGGTVYAYPTQLSWAPSIGSGYYGRGFEVVVYGGNVFTTSARGASIGRGHGINADMDNGNTTVAIYGGLVQAEGGGYDAAIETTDFIFAGGSANIVTSWNSPAIRGEKAVVSGGTLIAASNATGTVFDSPVSISGGTVYAIGRGTGTVLKKPVEITGGDFSALAVESSRVCDENLTLTSSKDVTVVYGEVVGEASGTLNSGKVVIPSEAKYLRATSASLSAASTGDANISASTFSEGSWLVIVGCSALIIGALLGFLGCRKLSDKRRDSGVEE